MLRSMPKCAYRGRIAVRALSTLMSPVEVLDVITPGPVKSTLKGALENGARRHNGRRK